MESDQETGCAIGEARIIARPGEKEYLCIDIVEYPMKPRKISMEIEV